MKKKKRQGGVEKILLCIPPRGEKKKLISILQPSRDFFFAPLDRGVVSSFEITGCDWRRIITAERYRYLEAKAMIRMEKVKV